MKAYSEILSPSPDVTDPESSRDWNKQPPQSISSKESVLAVPWAHNSIREHNSWKIRSEVHIQGLCKAIDGIHIRIQICQTLAAQQTTGLIGKVQQFEVDGG